MKIKFYSVHVSNILKNDIEYIVIIFRNTWKQYKGYRLATDFIYVLFTTGLIYTLANDF